MALNAVPGNVYVVYCTALFEAIGSVIFEFKVKAVSSKTRTNAQNELVNRNQLQAAAQPVAAVAVGSEKINSGEGE